MGKLPEFKLSNRVAIIVPSTDNETEQASRELFENMLDKVEGQFIDLFGGSTITDGRGGWKFEDGTKITEAVKIVESKCEPLSDEQISLLVDIALDVKDKMHQDAVSLFINDDLYFI